MRRIYYTKPSVGDAELELAIDAIRTGWGEHCYDYIHRFQNEFAEYLGVRRSVATSSCTGALHLGLRALNISPGDEVILADINWIASAAPIFYVGATPVLVDILEDSWCLDPEAVSRAITKRTRAIVAVHLYGNLAALSELRSLSEKHGVALIEDAAEALGSAYHGKKAGSISEFSVFSFHGTKVMTTGEGGCLATNNEALACRVEELNNHGRAAAEPRQFWPSELGYKYKISNVQAALGCAQLRRIDSLVQRKREIFFHYRDALTKLIPGAAMNPEPTGTFNSYWMPTLVLPPSLGTKRDGVLDFMRKSGIDARVFFPPLSDTPVFKDIRCVPTPRAHDLSTRSLNLPSYPDMTDADQQHVIDSVLKGLD